MDKAIEDNDIELITEWPVTSSCRDDEDSHPYYIPSKRSSTLPHPGASSAQSLKRKCGFQNEKVTEKRMWTSDKSARSKSNSHQLQTSSKNSCGGASLYASHNQDNTTCSLKPASSGPAEPLAQSRLARWWRRKGQQLVGFEGKRGGVGLPQTTNPNTLLFHVARLSEGKAFLADERQELKKRAESGENSADLLSALGSIEEWLGNTEKAEQWLKQAIDLEPSNKEWKWLLHKVERQQHVRMRQSELLPNLPPHAALPQPKEVERVSYKELDFHNFFHKYALGRRPVIITGIVDKMTAVPWDLQHIRNMAGECEAKVKQSVIGSVEWAGLEESRTLKVSHFLDNLDSGCHDYLFDWSLPLNCPDLAAELTIPLYFAGDFLQRSAPGSLYHDSWPSLFIAPSGVHSGLHVDAFASNFWMALFQGRKKWIFFQEDDAPCLYPVYAHSLDPTFEVNVDSPDLDTHPLFSLVHRTECILQAGELLFVPGGSPHYVENLDTSLAISANFVDLSNFHKVLLELDVNGLLDPRAADLAQQLRHPSFMSAMKRDTGDLQWADFKAWPLADVVEYDLH